MKGKYAQGGWKGADAQHPLIRPVEMRSTRIKKSDLKEEIQERTIAKITKIEAAKMKERDLRRIAEIRAGWSPKRKNGNGSEAIISQSGQPKALESPSRTSGLDGPRKWQRYTRAGERPRKTPKYKTEHRVPDKSAKPFSEAPFEEEAAM